MKKLIYATVALTATAALAFAGTSGPGPRVLNDQQLDQVVGGHLCDGIVPVVGGTFEGLQVFQVPEGDGSIHCALKDNGGIPIIIFTGTDGSGQVIILTNGTAR